MLQRAFGKSPEVTTRINLILRLTEGSPRVLPSSKQVPKPSLAPHVASCFETPVQNLRGNHMSFRIDRLKSPSVNFLRISD